MKAGSLCTIKNPKNHHEETVVKSTEYGYVHPSTCKVVDEEEAVDINAWNTKDAKKLKILCVKRVTNLEITSDACKPNLKNIFAGKLTGTKGGILCATEPAIETMKKIEDLTITSTKTNAVAADAAKNVALPIIGLRIEGGDAAGTKPEGCWR